MHKYYYFLNRKDSMDGFRKSINSRFFVDKSMLIEAVADKISTKEKWICVSRPRRFGKTMALEMLSAYLTRGVDADRLFDKLKIKNTVCYYKHLNTHNVICINFNDYFENLSVTEGIVKISERLFHDLKQAFPNILREEDDLILCLDMITQVSGEKFIFLIDEWDCVFRFHKGEEQEQQQFLSFMKLLLKDKSYVELAYITGILPIKKYNTGSALNMFREYTMLDPKKLAPFFGFADYEIEKLCENGNGVGMEQLKEWYDGYYMPEIGDVYNPRSVVEALEENLCRDYWNKTGGFSELEEYITMNFDGLGEDVTALAAGQEITVNVLGFSNDLDSFQDKDEVLTALIHLGYLTYKDGTVRIPNKEIREEFVNSIKKLSWGTVSLLLKQSRELMDALLPRDAALVGQLLESVHDDMQEFKEYNNEHTLKCVIHLAFYAASDDYTLQFESAAGKGYADCCMIPKKPGLPGIILELKYNGNLGKAIEQIKEKNYMKIFDQRVKSIYLVAINYDKKSKKHECCIEVVDNK